MAKSNCNETICKPSDSCTYKNILLIRFSAIGDVALSIPVVYSFCYANPNIQFTMLTQRFASTLFVNPPSNLKVIGVDTKTEYKGLRGIYKLYKNLSASTHYDAIADLHSVLRTHILTFLFANAAGTLVKRINKGRIEKAALTRAQNKRKIQLSTSRERYREVLRKLGLNEVVGNYKTIYDNIEPDPTSFEPFAGVKGEGEKWVAIAPFAKHKGKTYPIDSMKIVVDEIASWGNVKVILFGAGTYESGILDSWSEDRSNIISMAKFKCGIATELALMSYCDLMISMDSANMHLASLVALPVVSVWGATHPFCGFIGWGQLAQNAIQLNLACRPCSVFGNKSCHRGDYACMNNITPDMIIQRAKLLLSDND